MEPSTTRKSAVVLVIEWKPVTLKAVAATAWMTPPGTKRDQHN
jgi:hypothetical protein